MNQSAFRELLTNLKAAARLGQEDALDAALEGLLADRRIAANRALEAEQIQQRLLPLGEALAVPGVPPAYVRALLTSPYAAIRAVGAAALGWRYAQGRAGSKELRAAAGDRREEVRLALRLALQQAPAGRLRRLVDAWLSSPSPKQQALAVTLVPHLAPADALARLERLASLRHSEHPQVRYALADALAALAEQGAPDEVLTLLWGWVAESSPPLEVLGRVLRHPWAAGYAAEVQAMLDDLERRYGRRRALTNARRALERHLAARRPPSAS